MTKDLRYQPRFMRGWRTVEPNLAVNCYVPVERIIAFECHADFGWFAIMDYHDSAGWPVIIKGLDTDAVMAVFDGERPVVDYSPSRVVPGINLWRLG